MNADPVRVTRVYELGQVSQQLTFNNCYLSVNHSESVELTAAREGKVLQRVRKCFGIGGVLQRSHEHE